ncbi:GFA family protein [Phenylobacterium montanum]|uniref:GFA family protein n=1 Tax=Phenylobacterium montanum TaxID=2823693 RepID=A0A975FWW2_9CAUL|nr:GFA family protein [Caulobacter sp. S6]QUD86303.1 GFA family protein [Caulobacter sp. S6]
MTALSPVEGACHCGAVRLTLARAPQTLTDCNCSICRRYGVLWAYYRPDEVEIAAGHDATETYAWGKASILFHRCRTCGCVVRWTAVDPARNRTGVNARLLDLGVLATARVRHLDGAVTEAYLD